VAPWTVEDVESHVKGLDDKGKRQWVTVATGHRESCIASGKDSATCDVEAIKMANGVVEGAMHEHESLGEKVLSAVFSEGTVRQTVQGFLRAARAVAGHPKMPDEVKTKVEAFRQQLLSTWAGIIADDEGGTPEAVLASEAKQTASGAIGGANTPGGDPLLLAETGGIVITSGESSSAFLFHEEGHLVGVGG
jgi:hypothetical protein